MNGVKNFSLNKKNSTLLKYVIGAIVLFLFLGVLNLFSPQIKNLFYLASKPIEKQLWFAGESVSGFTSSILKVGSLSKENENLKTENQELLSQITFLQNAKNALENQADANATYMDKKFNLVMAGVMGLNNQDEITIDKGSLDGISDGMPVVNQYNVLFGRVSKVFNNFSKVMLISSKDSVLNVKVQQNIDEVEIKDILGVVKGNDGLSAFLDLVLVDDTLIQGNTLVTSSLEGTLPKGLLVGKITEVSKNDQNPHQQAKIQLFLEPSSNNLFVITDYNREEN